MTLRCDVRDVDGVLVDQLTRDLGVHPITARCLVGRGVTDGSEARRFLQPRLAGLRRPEGLPGLDEAIPRLLQALSRGERIACFGDYDVDGVTTAALMAGFLRAVGAEVEVAVARREAGYGLGVDEVERFASAGCRLLIAGDCGTSDREALERARSLGMDAIVVDHHTVPDLSGEHPALALVNPLRSDSSFPFRGMASVGLAFYLMGALRSALRESGHFGGESGPDLREYLDLVAVGTVADMVPLTQENRILTATGLEVLSRARRPGLAALMAAAGVAPAHVDSKAIAWKLAPRLNAAGRLGDARPALELMLADNGARASALVAELEELNRRRRLEQERVAEEAIAALDSGGVGSAAVAAGNGWASGVVGIVAAKLVERYARPAFVIAVDPETGEGRGSARSAGGVNLYRLLEQCGEHLVRYGGHAAAAGFTVRRERIGDLTAALETAVQREEAIAAPVLSADAEVELEVVDESLVGELSRLAPFGQENEEPLLVSRGLQVTQSRRVGDGSHLKLQLAGGGGVGLSAIAFGKGALDLSVGSRVDALYSPAISTFRGRSQVELFIRELHPL